MKKILSVVMVIMLAFSQLSAFASDYANGVESEEANVASNVYLVNSSGSTQQSSTTNVEVKDGTSYMIYPIPMPKLDVNQVFESFKFSVVTYDGDARDMSSYLRLYKLPGDSWDGASMTNSTISSYVNDYETYKAGLITQSVDTGTSGKNYRYTFDITDYANECRNQSVIYVAATIKTITAKVWVGTGDGAKYSPKYTFTPAAAPELSLEAISLSDGSEVATDATVSFTYSNPIASAEISLNGEKAEAEIASNVVTLTSELTQLKNYTLNIAATDIYSSSDSYSMNFSTGIDKGEISSNASKTLYISSTVPSTVPKGGSEVGYKNAYAYFKMPLPSVSSDGMIEKYTVTFYTYSDNVPSASPIQVYRLAGELWDETTLSTDDEVFKAIVADYDTYGIKNSVTYLGAGSANKEYKFEIDLTEYASVCLANGQSDMCIAITSTAYLKLYGTQNWTGYEYRKPATYAEVLTNPDIVPYDVLLKAPGSTLKSLSFKLLTEADNAADYAKLVQVQNGEEIDASFDYNSGTRKVTLVSPVALSEKTTYRVILKRGLTDNYGNALSNDAVVSEFTTGVDFNVAKPKLIASDTDISDYASAVSVAIAAKGSEYKYVTEVTNNTDGDFELVMAVAVYNAFNELIAFSFESTDIPNTGTDVVYSGTVTMGSEASCIKAFAWDKNYDPLTAVACAAAQAVSQ